MWGGVGGREGRVRVCEGGGCVYVLFMYAFISTFIHSYIYILIHMHVCFILPLGVQG